MSPSLVLLANTLAAVLLIVVASSAMLIRALGRRSAAVAALPLLTAGLLIAYVFGEDSYRGNGISRWDAYRSPGGALGPMFVLSVALMAATAAMIFYSGLRGHVGLLRLTAVAAGFIAFFLLGATVIGFSLN